METRPPQKQSAFFIRHKILSLTILIGLILIIGGLIPLIQSALSLNNYTGPQRQAAEATVDFMAHGRDGIERFTDPSLGYVVESVRLSKQNEPCGNLPPSKPGAYIVTLSYRSLFGVTIYQENFDACYKI